MFGRELLVSLALRERLGRLDETAAAVGIFVEIHVPSLGLFRRPRAGQFSLRSFPRKRESSDNLGPAFAGTSGKAIMPNNYGASGTSSLGYQGWCRPFHDYVKGRNPREFRHP